MGVFERGARWLDGHADTAAPELPQLLAGRIEGDVGVVLFAVEASDGSGPRTLVNFYERSPGGEWVWEAQGGYGWDDGPLAEGEVAVVGRSETGSSEGRACAIVGRARREDAFPVPGAPDGVLAETDPDSDAFVALWVEPS